MSALLGYVRVSTAQQTHAQQVDALTAAGVPADKVWSDTMSGAREDRAGLEALLAYAREGDTIVVWRLDRLGRSLSHIVRTVAELRERGIHVRSLTDGADSSTSTGRLMIGILASLAEYERELINERATVAREARARRGAPVGRKKSVTPEKLEAARNMRAAGTSMAEVCEVLGVSRSALYRELDAVGATG